MKEEERENAATNLNGKNWALLTREVKIMVSQIIDIKHELGCLNAKIDKMEELAAVASEKKTIIFVII